ncbi:MAG: molybdopterin converting factor subunit 1 [Alphaproteobacteria bacterium]|nr:molybdopterin converting factor subunit 1 [Alphaproteobacteria bacterium]|tara:strand:+ start:803 stop:1060 length:258 start_codon:yes stop_codon:yes gene_type:complete
MRILYFAWIRERVGCESEEITLPQNVSTVQDLINWLSNQGSGYQTAFGDLKIVRVAVNMEFSNFDHCINNEDEVAFFPPVTGGGI